MKKIAILTRDCAGINAAIRAVVRTAVNHDMDVIGVMRGYDGLIDGELIKLNHRSVSGIINSGGTILKTSRSERFYGKSGQDQAAKTLRDNGIEGLVVIGGNGSLSAAHILANKFGIPVVGIPATIDNDISEVGLTLGADTAVNVALDAIDKIRDTATSLERIFVVEVMGRSCGYIALNVALAGGCEEVLVPEMNVNLDTVCKEIEDGSKKGKASWIIVVAEGKAKAQDVADVITGKTGLETRVVVLGHIQRGGRPTATDRLLGSRLGSYAVEALRDGLTDHCVSIKDDKLATVPLNVAIQPKKFDVDSYYKLIRVLT